MNDKKHLELKSCPFCDEKEEWNHGLIKVSPNTVKLKKHILKVLKDINKRWNG